jgi:hypothetical protein
MLINGLVYGLVIGAAAAVARSEIGRGVKHYRAKRSA